MRCCRDVSRVIGRVRVFDHRHDRDRQVHPHRVDIGETKESWKLQFDLSYRCIGWFVQSDTNPWKQRGDESQFSLLAEHSLLEEPAPLCRRSFWSENLLFLRNQKHRGWKITFLILKCSNIISFQGILNCIGYTCVPEFSVSISAKAGCGFEAFDRISLNISYSSTNHHCLPLKHHLCDVHKIISNGVKKIMSDSSDCLVQSIITRIDKITSVGTLSKKHTSRFIFCDNSLLTNVIRWLM